jgi:hypothetical protein
MPPVQPHADRQQAVARDARRPQRRGRRPACQRQPVAVPVDEAQLLREDVATQVGHRRPHLDLADVQSQDVAGSRAEPQATGRPAAPPSLAAVVIALLDPTEADQVVGHRVDRRARQSRHGDQLGHAHLTPRRAARPERHRR